MTDVFSHVAVYGAGALNLTDPENPVRLNVGVVSRDFFATMGAPLANGRNFDEGETRPNGGRAAVLSNLLRVEAMLSRRSRMAASRSSSVG